jgi:uncharacterized cupin superfamily protein
MSIIKIKDAAGIPSEHLEDWGVPKTIGEPICQLRGRYISEKADGSEAGIWECTPGKFVGEVMHAEFTTFLTGRFIFHH